MVLVVQLDRLGVQLDSLGPVAICESLVALVLKLCSFFLQRRHLFHPRSESDLLTVCRRFFFEGTGENKTRIGSKSRQLGAREKLLEKPWRRKRNRWILLALGSPQDLGTLRNRKPLQVEIG